MWTECGLRVTEWGLDHPDGLVPIGGVGEGGADDRRARCGGFELGFVEGSVSAGVTRMDSEPEWSRLSIRGRRRLGGDPGFVP
jgi:hypothetical protein